MKRILSVILSLALLASLLIIPMSVSADTTIDSASLIEGIKTAAANLQVREDQKQQLFVPLGNHAFNDYSAHRKVIETEDMSQYAGIESTVGSKVIKLPTTYDTMANDGWGTTDETDALVSYQPESNTTNTGSTNSASFLIADIKSVSFAVKTNRPISIRLKLHSGNGFNTSKIVSIAAGDEWQTLNWNISDFTGDQTKIGAIFAVVDYENGGHGFGEGADVYFGSMFYEPQDDNVTRVENITGTDTDVLLNCIVAAEKITNDGRYTADSWKTLQSAIAAAKEAFLRTAIADTANGVSNIKTLLLSELEDAGTVEEVWKPQHRHNGNWENAVNVSDSFAEMIPNYNSELGSFVAKIENGYTHVSIVRDGMDSDGKDSNGGKNPIDVTKYDDMWMYVYNNTEKDVKTSQFIVVATESQNHPIAALSFPAKKLCRIEIDDVLKEANAAQTSNNDWNTNRLQVGIPTPTTGEVYFGTVFGLKKVDTTALMAATTIREIANYYINNVEGKGYINTADADETMDITTGIVLDTTAPIANITDKGTYYGSLTVTVKDDNLDTVKLNGKDVTLDEEGKFVVDAADGAQKIVITDMAGNKAEYEVTVLEVKGLDAESEAQGEKVVLTVDSKDKDSVDKTSKDKIDEKLEKGEKIAYFEIDLTKVSGGAITNATNVFEIKIPFDFAGKNTNVRVLHNHDGVVRVLDELTARPTGDLKDGKFYADKENNMIYIYTSKFSTFAVTYHTHTVKHVAATVATAEADGNIEYWYCEECGKYFSDAAATKEISKADTVVKYVAPSNGNTGSGSNTSGGTTDTGNSNAGTTLPGGTTDTGNSNAGTTLPGGTSPVTGQTAMTVVLFTILLGALAVMGISIVKSRKAKSK